MLLLMIALQQVPIQDFPGIDHPGVVPDLAAAIAQTCDAPRVGRAALLRHEDEASLRIREQPTADHWIELGCARAALDADHAIARPGLEMIAGASWAQGAERSALKALALRPGDQRASTMLALLTLDDQVPDDERKAVKAIARAVQRGAASPVTLRACSELALRIGDDRTARDCSLRGLASGLDSTWHLLRLSRLSFQSADTVAGSREFEAAAGAARDTTSRAEIAWQLQWFLSPAEQEAWNHLADTARVAWVRDHLAERDVRDGQPPGARLAEHFARLEYVLANFTLHLPQVVRSPHGLIGVVPENTVPDSMIKAYCEPGLVPARAFGDYRRWQHDIDDRALILDFEGEEFSGSAQATRLVSGVLGSYLCDIDSWRCGLTRRSIAAWYRGGAPPLKPEEIEHVRQDDRAQIAQATTTDDNSPRGDASIALTARLHRLWDPVSGAALALVMYALPIRDLSIQRDDARRTAVVDLQVRQWDGRATSWSDTTISRHLLLPDTSVKRPDVAGFVVVSSTSAVSAWSVVATQPAHRRGRAFDVATPGLATGRIALSDLLIGSETASLRWNLHGVEIPIAGAGVIRRDTTATLYFQVRSDADRSDLRTTVALYRIRDGVARDSAAIKVTFDQAVHQGISEIAPTIDLSRLDRGSYRLDVRLIDSSGKLLAIRMAGLDLE